MHVYKSRIFHIRQMDFTQHIVIKHTTKFVLRRFSICKLYKAQLQCNECTHFTLENLHEPPAGLVSDLQTYTVFTASMQLDWQVASPTCIGHYATSFCGSLSY